MAPNYAEYKNEPIAIVGSACHFAGGASNPSKLWDLLKDPRDVRKVIPKDRFNAEAYYHPNSSYHGHSNIRYSYMMDEDVTAFDTEFFGIKPIEAKAVDPQQRVLMETVYEGLESAGLTIDQLRGSDTAVYVGVMCSDYEANLLRDFNTAPTYTATGIGRSILSNRVSYFFDWHGPSITLDTACSSSLVAVHLAVQSLRAGESKVAVACGSNLLLGPENYIVESKLKMLSPDGRSKMWDRDANGYARGDGVASCVLKTLSQAIADGDNIECIIRETAINQDGATGGITMPSATAQQALIRKAYAKAGLDLNNPADRPQFFEAHGTGTPAGDPIEAEAISSAFFGPDVDAASLEKLHVGSIKTILGHTEGTAGIAAVLKASLGLQHSILPPNMLLENLSDRVAPFTKHLTITQTAKDWPAPAVAGQPRRASVNSFGFGGANAHAILESYEPPTPTTTTIQSSSSPQPSLQYSPFVFSAHNRKSLQSTLTAYADFLEKKKDSPSPINMRDLSYTLQSRRTAFQYRTSITACSTPEELASKIRAELEGTELEKLGTRFSSSSSSSSSNRPKVLAIFTGQGSQYARMGAELIEKSATARSIIETLQGHLDELPQDDLRPEWSLMSEICAGPDASRVTKGAFSSLSTAIQILLVDLLRLAGVPLDGVVGHSSGEVAAAYAAGYLSARDAIFVAYSRGHFIDKIASPNGGGIMGAMLAAGMPAGDAQDLCDDEVFKGRVCVAAVNSSNSVTISGDEDAIDEVKVILDDESLFNRKLRVDKAYHSNHMLSCGPPYVEAIKASGAKAKDPEKKISWVSSVHCRQVTQDMNLGDEYWAVNMISPVLFHQALSEALKQDDYDIAIEVGPHPVLKSPASQTMNEVLGKTLPYYGVLNRGKDAIQSFASCLGSVWSHLGDSHVNLAAYDAAVNDDKTTPVRVLKGLPVYQWNHEASHWHESRKTRKMRVQDQTFNPLLGTLLPDSAAHRLNWSHLLRASEIDWLSGHQVQTQTVFPAAGYICTALEGARVIAGQREVKLFELKDFVIHQALTFNQDDAGIEVSTCLSDIHSHPNTDRVSAKFTYSAGLGNNEDLTLVAQAEVEITLGTSSKATLPRRAPAPPHMISVDSGRFYSHLATLGYGFEGPFRSLSQLKRKLGTSVCAVSSAAREAFGEPVMVHPAEFDGAIQSLILAFSYPGDDQILTMHLPTGMRSIRVNPALCDSMNNMTVDAKLGAPKPSGFRGDVSLYTNDSSCAAIQLQDVDLVPMGSATAKDDRKVFSKIHWVNTELDGELASQDTTVTKYHEDVLMALERISTYYLRQFDLSVPDDSPLRSDEAHKYYLRYARHITQLVDSGTHKWAKKEWLNDTKEDMLKATEPFSHLPDVRVMHLVGEKMPLVFKGETNMLEEMRVNNVLDEYYVGGFGFLQSGLWMSRTIAQLAERHPHLNILEIGAGTGGATKRILKHLGQNFLTYTFTDLSSGFFEVAADVLSDYKERMVFKTLDCGKDPTSQGYVEGGYDVVAASLVIHATPDLEVTMRNLRKLVKPGGYLVVADGSNNGQPHGTGGFIFGTLPGWWLGAETDRPLSPFVSTAEWERLLKVSGFAGIDSTAGRGFEDVIGMTCFAAQAVDDRVEFLREPMAIQEQPKLATTMAPTDNLVIVGGKTPNTARLVKALQDGIQSVVPVHTFENLGDVDHSLITADSTVVSLSEMDKPVFKDMTPDEFLHFKTMFLAPTKLLWVTSGRLDEDPFSNMTVGFARTAVHETPLLHFQNIDIADPASFDPKHLVKMVLRFQALVAVPEADTERLLWAKEPEICIDAAGNEIVPRLRHIPARNDRYNSARRPITHQVDTTEHPAVLEQAEENGTWSLTQISKWGIRAEDETTVKLTVSHSVKSAVRTAYGHKFLVLGTDSNKSSFLALVPQLLSVVTVPKESVLPCPSTTTEQSADQLLAILAANLVALAVVDPLVGGETVVVHNPSQLLASAISTQAATKDGVSALIVVDASSREESSSSSDASWTELPPYMTKSEASGLIPATTASFVGLSNSESENEATILSTLPPHCRKETIQTLYASAGWEGSAYSTAQLGRLLQRAVDATKVNESSIASSTTTTTTIDDLVNRQINPADPATIVNWTVSESSPAPPVNVTRLDSAAFFKGDKTYWMCGLSGALGVSLCDWMIERGAKYLVLTSRNPNISPDWIKDHAQNGVNVTIVPCDVTNEPALRAAHKEICDTLPPIIGVLNGAMVLRDISIQNMSFEHMSDVFRPKVYGSIHLDRIFATQKLDFFILFSSINCVIGNLGQANYAAANTFMCSLAAQRRKRGLAATALNVGAIIGAGYMERESSKALDLTVSKMALMHLSEQDYHQLFAEGIDAGLPSSEDEAELTTGLLDIPANGGPDAPKWHANPVFASFIAHQVEQGGADSGGEATQSIKEQLAGCKTETDVLAVVKRTFAAQLRNVLQTTTADEDLMSARSSGIGLDSLISVDIRSWLLKNFEVGVPVLKIMGNDTMADIAELVASQVPAGLYGTGAAAAADTSSAPAAATPAPAKAKVPASTTTNTSSSSSPTTGTSTPNKTPGTGTTTPGDMVKIDWNLETSLPTPITLSNSSQPASLSSPQTIILTGVSGLLGRALLNRLLASPSVHKIICLATRRLSSRLSSGELPSDPKIEYHSGDLTHPTLGLTDSSLADAIFSAADAVIHNGADTSHLKFYPAIKDANTSSTRYLLSMCLSRNIPIHYLSTVGVALFDPSPSGFLSSGFRPVSVADHLPPSDGSHGYIAAKWASEQLLEKATKEFPGYKAWVHRPSTIIREDEGDKNSESGKLDWMNELVGYMLKTRAVPGWKNLKGALDFVGVDGAANSILGCLGSDETKGIKFVHQVGDVVVPLEDMRGFVTERTGDENVQVLGVADWADKAVKAGLNRGVAALIEGMDDVGGAHYPRMLRG